MGARAPKGRHEIWLRPIVICELARFASLFLGGRGVPKQKLWATDTPPALLAPAKTIRAEKLSKSQLLRPKERSVSVSVSRLIRHGARVSAAAAFGAIVFLAARMRVLAAPGLLLAAIHRARFAASLFVTARLGILIVLRRA